MNFDYTRNMNSIEMAFIVSSIISTGLSLSVLLTAVVFPVMRKRLFMQIIIYISICDVIASAASALGFVPGTSPLCPVQSFLVIFFYKASWLWTTALTHQLYSIVITGHFGLKQYQMHLVCWLVPLISTLLPLSTTGYGRSDDDNIAGWCYLTASGVRGELWSIFTLMLVLFGAFVLMTFFLLRIYCRYRSVNMQKVYPEVYAILDALMLYPPGFFLTWGPNLIFAILLNAGVVKLTQQNSDAFSAVTILATQSGSVLAIIFFIKSREARYRWWALLRGNGNRRNEEFHPSSNSLSPSDDGIPRDFKHEDKYGFDDEPLRSEIPESEVYNPYGGNHAFSSPFREEDSISSITLDDRFASVDLEAPSARNSEIQMTGSGWNTPRESEM